jgi:hypothetical protein
MFILLFALGAVFGFSVYGAAYAQDVRLVYASYGGFSLSLAWMTIITLYTIRLESRDRLGSSNDYEMAARQHRSIIANSKTPPWGKKQVLMESWEDLLKVATVLRRPILKFAEQKSEGLSHHMFFVTDGETNYVFEFQSEPFEAQMGAQETRKRSIAENVNVS